MPWIDKMELEHLRAIKARWDESCKQQQCNAYARLGEDAQDTINRLGAEVAGMRSHDARLSDALRQIGGIVGKLVASGGLLLLLAAPLRADRLDDVRKAAAAALPRAGWASDAPPPCWLRDLIDYGQHQAPAVDVLRDGVGALLR